ncbi:MAG: sigma-70 family RNA polymerase sigma factor [Spirochaetaceae bacterium]|jgi:RNA polymerase sigma-70 factor (ECF subfamily)|nr:sigma-70 family RNA polymerase sigma factor [Spirochaetaceae bacterium]
MKALDGDGDGGDAAFDGIVKRYYERILKFCLYALGGNVSAAEDCAQDIFLILYENMGKLRDYDRIGGWLYKTAGNISKRYAAALRKERGAIFTPRSSPSGNADDGAPHDGWEAPVDRIPARTMKTEAEQAAEEKALDRAAAAIRDRLKPADGRVLELAFHQKLPLKEVASRLGLSLSAVKSRVSRLRHKVNVLARELLID